MISCHAMTQWYALHASLECVTRLIALDPILVSRHLFYVCHDKLKCLTRLFGMCDTTDWRLLLTLSYCVPWLILYPLLVCAMTHRWPCRIAWHATHRWPCRDMTHSMCAITHPHVSYASLVFTIPLIKRCSRFMCAYVCVCVSLSLIKDQREL